MKKRGSHKREKCCPASARKAAAGQGTSPMIILRGRGIFLPQEGEILLHFRHGKGAAEGDRSVVGELAAAVQQGVALRGGLIAGRDPQPQIFPAVFIQAAGVLPENDLSGLGLPGKGKAVLPVQLIQALRQDQPSAEFW